MKKHHILFTAIGIIILGSILWWFFSHMAGENEQGLDQVTTYNNEEVGFSVTYKSRLFETEITEVDKAEDVWLRLRQPNFEAPFQLSFRTEDGKQIAASSTGKSTHELILESAKLGYPGEYNSFELVSERKYQIDGHDTAELVFNYVSEGLITQRFVVIEKNEDEVIYITTQAKQEDFDDINSKYFEDIIQSVRF